MAKPQIKFDQFGLSAGVAGKSREDIVLDTPVTATCVGTYLAYRWSIVDAPPNATLTVASSAILDTPNAQVCHLTPDNQHTYLLKLEVDSGQGIGFNQDESDPNSDVTHLTFYAGPTLASGVHALPIRRPAFDEAAYHNSPTAIELTGNTRGWKATMDRWFSLVEYIAPLVAGEIDLTRLPLGSANTVMWSDGATNQWSGGPVVTTITGTTSVHAGPVGASASLAANALTFASGNSSVTAVGTLAINCDSRSILKFQGFGTASYILFDSSNTAAIIGWGNATGAASSITIAAQTTSSGTLLGGDLHLSSGAGASSAAGNVYLEVGGVVFFSCQPDGINANGYQLHDLQDPTSPQDSATKAYVDAVSTGIKVKTAVAAISVTNIASLSGLATTVDGVLLNVDNTRVLLQGQSTSAQNGIYLVHSGAWTRSADLAVGANAAGAYAFVTGGTVYGSSGWICTNVAGSDVVGTHNLTFSQFTAAGQTLAGAGLTKTGQTIDVVAADGTIVVAADSIRVGTIGDSNIAAGVGWGKLTGYPTIATTAPLTGGGSISAGLTLAISAASGAAAGSMSAAHWTKLNGMTISGTAGNIPKFTGTSTIGNSLVTDLGIGTVIGIGSGYFGHAFFPAAGWKLVTIGTSYFDGDSHYITPYVGSNSIAEIVFDTAGIGFVVLPSSSGVPRGDTAMDFLSWERVRISSTGLAITGSLSVSSFTDTSTFAMRTGAALGLVMTSDAAGVAVWDSIANAGFTPWTAYVTINTSDTNVQVGSITVAPDLSRISSAWVIIYEIWVYARTSSSTTALVVMKIEQSIAIQYDGSGNATIMAVTAEASNNDVRNWANHTGGVPTITGIGLGAVVGNSVPIQLSKPASGAVFSARSRYRPISIMKTTDWY